MNIIEKNILTVESGIICQQVNCQGKMNSGLAKAIREKWPIVYEDYLKSFKQNAPDFEMLGEICPVRISTNLIVCNIFGQLFYGRNERQTEYSALKFAFSEIRELNNNWFTEKQDIYFPYLMSCNLGGGNWAIVSKMIDYYFPNAIICKLPIKA